jgi:hypothetical protein
MWVRFQLHPLVISVCNGYAKTARLFCECCGPAGFIRFMIPNEQIDNFVLVRVSDYQVLFSSLDSTVSLTAVPQVSVRRSSPSPLLSVTHKIRHLSVLFYTQGRKIQICGEIPFQIDNEGSP